MHKDISRFLIRSPNVCGGSLRIEGTRITVIQIVLWYKQGYSIEEIAELYPHLTLPQIYAALAHFHANREIVEAEIASERQMADALENEYSQTGNMRYANLSQRGFTLIELMVVIVILGILATMIVPNIMDTPDEAKQAKAKVDMTAIETALKMYKLHNGSYPTTEQGLQALVSPPETGGGASNWKEGGYLEKGKVPLDPWGNDYVYLSPGVNGSFDITSYGADGVPGGDGKNKDINNWEIE